MVVSIPRSSYKSAGLARCRTAAHLFLHIRRAAAETQPLSRIIMLVAMLLATHVKCIPILDPEVNQGFIIRNPPALENHALQVQRNACLVRERNLQGGEKFRTWQLIICVCIIKESTSAMQADPDTKQSMQ